jgi:hypothetical protein
MDGNFVIGVDLGQVYDYSALAVVERLVKLTIHPFEPAITEDHHHVRYLKRWQHGTKYEQVVADTGALMVRAGLQDAVVVIDGTGVGREVALLFDQAYRVGRLGHYWPVAYIITGGREVTHELVPKRELVGKMQTLLQGERFKVADALELAPLLKKELENFRIKTLPTGHDSYESAREGDHDDIVIAAALACWFRHSHSDPRYITDAAEVATT